VSCVEEAGVRTVVRVVVVAVIACFAWVENAISAGARHAGVRLATFPDGAVTAIGASFTGARTLVADPALADGRFGGFGTRPGANVEATGVVAVVCVVAVTVVARLGSRDGGYIAVAASLHPVGRAVAIVVWNADSGHGRPSHGTSCGIAGPDAVSIKRVVETVAIVVVERGRNITRRVVIHVECFVGVADPVGIGVSIEVVRLSVTTDESSVGVRRGAQRHSIAEAIKRHRIDASVRTPIAVVVGAARFARVGQTVAIRI
jgi:hypothetical protein